MAAPQNERALSSRMVTGPSPADSMVISAPKRPVAVLTPPAPSRSATAATSGAACSGRAAATNEGLRPLRVSPYKVNWLTTKAPPPDSTTERFILPSASSNTRSVATLSASQAAWADPSSWVTPTSTSRPAPISPTTSVFTSTRAHATLETTARTGWLLLLGAGALRDDPEGVVDAVHALDRGQLEGEPKGGDPVAPGGDRGRHDVDVVVRKDLGDVAEQLGAVQRLHLDGDREHRWAGAVPGHVDHAVGVALQVGGVGTVGAVDADAVPAGDESDDRVTRHRSATSGELDPDVVDPLDQHAPAGRQRAGWPGGAVQGEVVVLLLLLAEVGLEAVDHAGGGDLTRADSGVEGVQRGEAHLGGQRRQGAALGEPLQRQAGFAHGADQRLLAGLDGVLAPLLGEPLADLVARPRCLDDRQPVPRRPGVWRLGGEDLHRLAVLERVLQRHEPLVDPRAHAAVADLGVHGVGAVDRGRARRELEDVALGREDEHLVDVEVGLEVVDEVLGVRQLPLPVDELP